ncbi:MAG TPA: CvpA family protein [Planctomycetaceae bacterium]|nr:CvpA family protein [Planctomycetaceae bacterium]
MIDVLLLLILAGVTWCVASEGAWGAALTFLSVLFAGLLAMNYFELLAGSLEGMGSSPAWSQRCDVIALVVLFAAGVFVLRLGTEKLAPTFMPTHPLVYEIGRWSMGLATGYLTMAILLTAVHTAPLPRWVTAAGVSEFIPGFKPERKNFFHAVAPDRQWLGFVQYVSRKSLPRGRVFDGPRFSAGDYQDTAATPQYWPSFPIRYATRRDQIATGGGVAVAPGDSGGGLRPISPAPGGGGGGRGGGSGGGPTQF